MKIERRGKMFVITQDSADIETFGNFDEARNFLATKGNKDAQAKMYKMSSSKINEFVENYTPSFITSRRR